MDINSPAGSFTQARTLRRGVLILLSLWFGLAGQAQKTASEILAFPPEERLKALWNWYNPELTEDTLAMHRYFHQLEKDFEARNEIKLQQMAWLKRVDYESVYRNFYNQLGLDALQKAIEEARSRGWKNMEAECELRKGLMYYAQLNYGPAFEYIQKGYTKLKAIGFDQCPLIIQYLEEIGKCYYEFGDTESAIHYLREALDQTTPLMNPSVKRRTMNTIGLCFTSREQYDSAIHYYTLAHQNSVMARDTFWAALANGNKGNVYFLQGRYDEAIPLMETDYQQSIRYKDWSSASNAAGTLATMYLQKGEVEKAQEYLDYAQQHLNYGDARNVSGFYKNLAAISRLKGDYDAAFRYLDSAQVYRDKYNRERDSRIINQAKLKVEVDRHAHEMQKLETARSRQVLLRNGMLAILLLSGVIGVLLVRQQRMKRNEEMQLATLRQKAAEDELLHAKKQLQVFTNALKEKNELVESFRQEIELIQQSGEQRWIDRTEQMNQLIHSTILTEEDWKEFRIMFDKVHPGFFIRLKEKFNDLTPAETRLLALTKLDLAPKEMAAMLGISYDAIKKSRQRLRKKINLPEEGSLTELVEHI